MSTMNSPSTDPHGGRTTERAGGPATPGRAVGPAEPGAPPGVPAADPRRWIAVAVVLVASFMQLLDGTITNMAIPVIQRDLHATDAQIQFIVAAYLVAYAALLIPGGRIGDIIGRRRAFMTGMVGFIAASVVCGVTQSGLQLDLARAVQGVTAALMLPQVLAVMQVMFPSGSSPADRAKAFAFYGLTLGLPAIFGPFIGGAILQADIAGLGWRPIFLVNVPIGLIVLALAARYLPESKAAGTVRLDLLGVALVSIGLLLFIGLLVQGRQAGWPTWTWIGLAVALAVFLAFWRWEARLTERGEFPLMPVDLFRDRAFGVGLLITLTVFAGFTPLVFFFSLYLQLGLGYSPLAAGVTTVPFAVGSMATAIASAVLAPRLGRRILTLGAAVVCLGMGLLVLSISVSAIPLPHGWQIAPALFVSGLGLGLLVAPLINVILGASRTADAGAASGVLNNVNIVAGALGVALFGVIFFGHVGAAHAEIATAATRLRTELAAHVPDAPNDALAGAFGVCTQARLADGATVEVASCRQLAGLGASTPGQGAAATVDRLVADATADVFAHTFTSTIRLTILSTLAAFALVFVLTFALPRTGTTGHHGAEKGRAA